MALAMKVITISDRRKDRVLSNTLINPSTQDNLLKTKFKDKENLSGLMGTSIQVIGSITKCMVKVFTHGRGKRPIKAHFFRIKEMVLG
jgi:hypothetical protein